RRAAHDAANLAAVVDAMQRIFQHPTADATRVDLCGTASRVALADSAVLWEPGANGDVLVPVAAAGEDIIAHEIVLGDQLVGAAHAYVMGEPCFARLADRHRLELDPEERESVLCALWQPLL